MKTEEAMSINSDPDVVLLNAVLEKISTNPFLNSPNEGPESRLGRLIASYFRGGDIGEFLTCMEIAFKESLPEVTGPKPCEDPVIGNCPSCHLRNAHLNFWEEEAWNICYRHRVRWLIAKSLYCAQRDESERILGKLAEQAYYLGTMKRVTRGIPKTLALSKRKRRRVLKVNLIPCRCHDQNSVIGQQERVKTPVGWIRRLYREQQAS